MDSDNTASQANLNASTVTWWSRPRRARTLRIIRIVLPLAAGAGAAIAFSWATHAGDSTSARLAWWAKGVGAGLVAGALVAIALQGLGLRAALHESVLAFTGDVPSRSNLIAAGRRRRKLRAATESCISGLSAGNPTRILPDVAAVTLGREAKNLRDRIRRQRLDGVLDLMGRSAGVGAMDLPMLHSAARTADVQRLAVSSGRLAPKLTATETFCAVASLNPRLAALPSGMYDVAVAFTELTTGHATGREVRLRTALGIIDDGESSTYQSSSVNLLRDVSYPALNALVPSSRAASTRQAALVLGGLVSAVGVAAVAMRIPGTAARIGTPSASGNRTLGNTQPVDVVVSPKSAKLVLHTDKAITRPGTPVIVNVIDNDEGGVLGASVVLIGDPAAMKSNGDGTVTFTPQNGAPGQQTFVYRACNAAEVCDVGVVEIDVRLG